MLAGIQYAIGKIPPGFHIPKDSAGPGTHSFHGEFGEALKAVRKDSPKAIGLQAKPSSAWPNACSILTAKDTKAWAAAKAVRSGAANPSVHCGQMDKYLANCEESAAKGDGKSKSNGEGAPESPQTAVVNQPPVTPPEAAPEPISLTPAPFVPTAETTDLLAADFPNDTGQEIGEMDLSPPPAAQRSSGVQPPDKAGSKIAPPPSALPNSVEPGYAQLTAPATTDFKSSNVAEAEPAGEGQPDAPEKTIRESAASAGTEAGSVPAIAELLAMMTAIRPMELAQVSGTANPKPPPVEVKSSNPSLQDSNLASSGGTGKPPLGGELAIDGVILQPAAKLPAGSQQDDGPPQESPPRAPLARTRRSEAVSVDLDAPAAPQAAQSIAPGPLGLEPGQISHVRAVLDSAPRPSAEGRPAASFEPPAPGVPVPGPARIHRIDVRVPGLDSPVGLVVSEVAGEVRISVRTSNPALAARMRSGVEDLTAGLSNHGMDFQPGPSMVSRAEKHELAANALLRREEPVAAADGTAFNDANSPESSGDREKHGGRGSNGRQQQQDRRQNNHDNRNGGTDTGSGWQSVWSSSEPV